MSLPAGFEDQLLISPAADGKIDIVEPRTGHLWLKYEMQQIVFQCNNPGMSVVDVTVHYQLVNVGSAVHSFVVAGLLVFSLVRAGWDGHHCSNSS